MASGTTSSTPRLSHAPATPTHPTNTSTPIPELENTVLHIPSLHQTPSHPRPTPKGANIEILHYAMLSLHRPKQNQRAHAREEE